MSAKLYRTNHLGAISTVIEDDLPTDVVLVSDSAGKITSSSITNTELDSLDGIKSNIQNQLDSINNATVEGTTLIL